MHNVESTYLKIHYFFALHFYFVPLWLCSFTGGWAVLTNKAPLPPPRIFCLTPPPPNRKTNKTSNSNCLETCWMFGEKKFNFNSNQDFLSLKKLEKIWRFYSCNLFSIKHNFPHLLELWNKLWILLKQIRESF